MYRASSSILSCLLASSAAAADHVVGPSGHATVGQALAAAQDGDRILIAVPRVREAIDVGDKVVEILTAGVNVTWSPPDDPPGWLIDVDGGGLTVSDLLLDGEDRAGFVRINGGSLTLQGVTTRSTRASQGSVIQADASDVTLLGSTLTAGLVDGDGGLIATHGGTLQIAGSELRDAIAGDEGGALYTDGTSVVLTDSSLCRNHARDDAAIVLKGGSAEVIRCLLCDNTSDTNHVLLALATSGTFANNLFYGNVLQGHGTLDLTDTDALVLHNAFIDNHTAEGGAAVALFLERTQVELTNNLIGSNDSGSLPAVFRHDTVTPDQLLGGHNLYHDNTGGHTDTELPSDQLGVDPLLSGAQACAIDGLQPAGDSPLIDAGDPDLLDPDGSRSDIGLFGGPHAPADGFGPGPGPTDTGTPPTDTEPGPPPDRDGDGVPDAIDPHPDDPGSDGPAAAPTPSFGVGCATSGGPAGLLLAVGGLLAIRRRRD